MSPPEGPLQADTGLADFVDGVLKLKQTAASDDKAGVTISVHNVTAPKGHNLPEEKFVICAIGDMRHIQLPGQVIYHDPRHLWLCVTWYENNSDVKERIENSWPQEWPESMQLAKHLVYVCSEQNSAMPRTQSNPKQLLEMDSGSPDVRYRQREMNKHNMEAWSHEHKPNSVANLLEDDEIVCGKLIDIRNDSLRKVLLEARKLLPPNQELMRLSTTKLCHCKRNKRGVREHREQEFLDITSEESDTHIIFSQPIPSISLIRQLHENQDFMSKTQKLLAKASKEASMIINRFLQENKEKIPTSFKYPTMQLQIKKLAYPNNLGASAQTGVRPQKLFFANENEAHMICAKPQAIECNEITPSEAEELVTKIKWHYGCRSP